MVTVTPGMTASDASVTRPLMAPVPDVTACAKEREALVSNNARQESFDAWVPSGMGLQPTTTEELRPRRNERHERQGRRYLAPVQSRDQLPFRDELRFAP
jgi:hypothetical protein